MCVRAFESVCLCVCEIACFHVCAFVHICVCVCVYCILTDRPEDHRGCPDPVCEEAVGCNDSDRVLSKRLCAHWTAALHGKPTAEVCNLADQHDRAVTDERQQGL